MLTTQLRHCSSSLTTTHHHLETRTHTSGDVITLEHCVLIKGTGTVVGVLLQVPELSVMALALPVVLRKCTSERQGRKGGGIVA